MPKDYKHIYQFKTFFKKKPKIKHIIKHKQMQYKVYKSSYPDIWTTEITLFSLQQAFNATAVIRHMRRLQLSTGGEAPNPSLPGQYPTHLLMPEEGAGTAVAVFPYHQTRDVRLKHFSLPQELVVKAVAPRTSTVPRIRCPTAPTAATQPAVSDPRPTTCTVFQSWVTVKFYPPRLNQRHHLLPNLIWLGVQRNSNLSPAGGASTSSPGGRRL